MSGDSLSLTLSDSLYIMTLSDLHHHMGSNSHPCMKLNTVPGRVLDFLPLPEYSGFAFKRHELNTMPWHKLCYIFNSRSEFRQPAAVLLGTCWDGQFSSTSPTYKFFERELFHDPWVTDFFQKKHDSALKEVNFDHIFSPTRLRTDGDLNSPKSYHTDNCSFCEEYLYDENGQNESLSGSDTPYIPSAEAPSSESEVESEGSDLESEKEALKIQRELLMEHVVELEKTTNEMHRALISQMRVLMIQEQGKKMKFNRELSTRQKTVFCHTYNNNGYCKFYKACCYKHEDAPTCKFDRSCTRNKCGYYHTPNPSPALVSLREQIRLIDELFENYVAGSKKVVKDADADVVMTDVVMTDVDKIKCVQVCNVDAELISMVGGLAITQDNEDKENVAAAANQQDVKIEEISFEDSGEEGPWEDFRSDLQTKSRSQFDTELKAIKDEKDEIRRRLCAEDKNKKLPAGWEDGFPEHNNFPFIFLLTYHPTNVSNLHLSNRKQIGNCLTWHVMETTSNIPLLDRYLGVAVMLPNFPNYGDQTGVLLFGEDEPLGLCMFDGDTAVKSIPSLSPCPAFGQPNYMKYFDIELLPQVYDPFY